MLILENITKKFKDFYALNKVCLKVEDGHVHTLLGENGAGKSTLMNILCGLYQPASGEIIYNHERRKIDSPQKARELGIAMVHQHFMLIEAMTVLENIMLCSLEQKGILLDKESVLEKVLKIQEAYDLSVDVGEKVNMLSVGQQQKVEIIKALFNEAQLLILDEPTSVLTDEEAQGLFKIIKKLKEKNKSVIFISHKLKEVMQISDKVTVLRRGETITTVDPGGYSGEELAGLMVGEKVIEKTYDKLQESGEIIYELKNVSFHKNSKHSGLSDINLQIKGGEILGVAGIDGNGQSQLAEILTGLKKPEQGERIYQDKKANGFSVSDFVKNGVAHIPEDRNKMGLIGDMEIKENLLLKDLDENRFSMARGWFLRKKAIQRYAVSMKEKYDIRCSGVKDEVRVLSGGNQQKIILARELERSPRFVVAMNPTRGLDIGATKFVYDCLIAARDRGCSILIVSADIDEIVKLSDRIVVMYEGRIMGEVSGAKPDMLKISSMMGGKSFATIHS
ncbi:MAG TPA: heme ABC transporter ATP-binding protein [Firmicutes bacterium]|jgi:general nucleoside transport system ATP-binding protein|nr:heme ABC transporter ATP-binding protein [Bacillota bacterium]